jgi:hypothetical protein
VNEWLESFRDEGGDFGRDTFDYFEKYPEMLKLVKLQGALEEREAILEIFNEELKIEAEALKEVDVTNESKAFHFAIKCAAKWVEARNIDQE